MGNVILILYLLYGRGVTVTHTFQDMDSCKASGRILTKKVANYPILSGSDFYMPHSDGGFDCVDMKTNEIFSHRYKCGFNCEVIEEDKKP